MSPDGGDASFTNEHCAYAALPKPDRHALRDLLKAAFPIGGSSHKLWSEFHDTTAFVRRMHGGGPAEGIIGGAIVMSHLEDQYDYLAYLAILPDYRHRKRLFTRRDEPHHGTELLHYVYDTMRGFVSPSRLQHYLMIEPAGGAALRFYLQALPANDYPVKIHEPAGIISVGYDGLVL